MSITPYGRRYEPAHQWVWDPFRNREDFRAAPVTPHMGMAFAQETSSMVSSQIECRETPEAYVYKAHLPGLKHNEVRVEVDDDRVLSISGEKRVEKEDRTGRWHRVELSSGQFLQRLRLPENARVDHVKAHMDNGVLTVTVPKHQVGHNRYARTINISGH